MIGETLLYLLATDLRELADEELRACLELIAGSGSDPVQEVQEKALDLLQHDQLDRTEIESLPEDYPDLLPSQMSGYEESLDQFDALLEQLFEDDSLENNGKVERFRACLEILHDEGGWEDRSEAARGLATLEEELFRARDAYQANPMTIEQCNPRSVVSHQSLLDAFDIWQKAFRLAHQGELAEALEVAVEGTYLFAAVKQWAN